jgi:hypothetical protein
MFFITESKEVKLLSRYFARATTHPFHAELNEVGRPGDNSLWYLLKLTASSYMRLEELTDITNSFLNNYIEQPVENYTPLAGSFFGCS